MGNTAVRATSKFREEDSYGGSTTTDVRITLEDGTFEVKHSYNGDDGRSDACTWSGGNEFEGTYSVDTENNKIKFPNGYEVKYEHDDAKDAYKALVIFKNLPNSNLNDGEEREVWNEADFFQFIRNKNVEKFNEYMSANRHKFGEDICNEFEKKPIFWFAYDLNDFELIKSVVLHGFLPSPWSYGWNINNETTERIQFFYDHKIITGNSSLILSSFRDRFDLFEYFINVLGFGDSFSIPFQDFTNEQYDKIEKAIKLGIKIENSDHFIRNFLDNDSYRMLKLFKEYQILNEDSDIWEVFQNSKVELLESTITEIISYGFTIPIKVLEKLEFASGDLINQVIDQMGDIFTTEYAEKLLMKLHSNNTMIKILLNRGLLDVTQERIFNKIRSCGIDRSTIPYLLERGVSPKEFIYTVTRTKNNGAPDEEEINSYLLIASKLKELADETACKELLGSSYFYLPYYFASGLPYQIDEESAKMLYKSAFTNSPNPRSDIRLLAERGFPFSALTAIEVYNNGNNRFSNIAYIDEEIAHLMKKTCSIVLAHLTKSQQSLILSLFTSPDVLSLLAQ